MPAPDEPIMRVTDLEGDTGNLINFGQIVAPQFSSSSVEQVINLPNGWFMFSFFIDTDNIDNWDLTTYPNVIMSALLKQFLFVSNPDGNDYPLYNNVSDFSTGLVIVKDSFGHAYLPAFDFDGMGDLSVNYNNVIIHGNFQGFQIKTSRPDLYIKVSGPLSQPNNTFEMPLFLGWNIISYPSNTPINAEVFFENLVANDSLIIAKDYLGAAYIPEYNFNGLPNMIPGEGYQVKTENIANGDTFTAIKSVNEEIIDISIDEFIDVPTGVIVVPDTAVQHNETNMTIRIPTTLIENFFTELHTRMFIDAKIDILLRYFNNNHEISKRGSEETLAIFLANEYKQTLEQDKQEKKRVPNNFEDVLIEINDRKEKEVNGYPLAMQKFIDVYWQENQNNFLPNNRTLLDTFRDVIKENRFVYSLIVYNQNLSIVVGKTDFLLTDFTVFKEGGISLSIAGDDATVTGVDGLLANEIPRVFLFTGEQYHECTFTLESGDLTFVDKKNLNVTSINLGAAQNSPT